MDVEERAARARALLEDDFVKFVLSEIRSDAYRQFLVSAPSDHEALREAHAKAGAADAFEARLKAHRDAGTLREHKREKGRHRG